MIQMIKLGEKVEKIVEMKNLAQYKEALRLLDCYGISFDRVKLFNNPELCLDIINIFKYFEE